VLNQDHVLHLAELYESGVELPPVLVTRTGILVDGRHRVEALDMLGRKAVPVNYSDETEEAELVFRAMRANVGGSLPPSRADINHTIRVLLDLNVPVTRITTEFPFPPSMVRRHIANVKSTLTKEKTLRAVRDVQQGMTVMEAASKHAVKMESVRDVIGGNRRKKASVSEIKGSLTGVYRGRSRALANVFTQFRDKMESGEIPTNRIEEIMDHVDGLHKTAAKTIRDWHERFVALKKSLDGV